MIHHRLSLNLNDGIPTWAADLDFHEEGYQFESVIGDINMQSLAARAQGLVLKIIDNLVVSVLVEVSAGTDRISSEVDFRLRLLIT